MKDDNNFSKKVLTIGGQFHPPRGGINAVLYGYERYIYEPFYFVAISTGKRSVENYITRLLCPFRIIWQLVAHPSIRIVHIHTPSYRSFVYAVWVARLAHLFGRKTVMHMHGGGFKDYYSQNKNFVRKELQKANGIVALSETWRDFYKNEVAASKVYVIPNIVDLPQYKEVKKNSCFNFLFLGFIYKGKGIFDLVELLCQYQKEYRNRLVLYVGGGQKEEARLREYISEHQLSDIVKMCGWVEGEKKIELFNKADAFILPSYKEGLPVSIIESMTYGLPILSTRVGGIPELVEDGKNGILFEPGDKDAMKRAIDKLLNNENLRSEMSMSSKEMSKKYLPQQVKKELGKMYSSIL